MKEDGLVFGGTREILGLWPEIIEMGRRNEKAYQVGTRYLGSRSCDVAGKFGMTGNQT